MMAKNTTPATAPIEAERLVPRIGSGYPAPFAAACAAREKRALGDPFGLSHFGVNLVRLKPGAASSQRHWHSREDELVYILEGEVVLVTDAGEQVMTPGMCMGFPAGAANGHQLVNRSGRDAVYLEVGDRMPGDDVDYPDIDMLVRTVDGKRRYLRKNGIPY
jgi:uncharacterized cupin superfamily protein